MEIDACIGCVSMDIACCEPHRIRARLQFRGGIRQHHLVGARYVCKLICICGNGFIGTRGIADFKRHRACQEIHAAFVCQRRANLGCRICRIACYEVLLRVDGELDVRRHCVRAVHQCHRPQEARRRSNCRDTASLKTERIACSKGTFPLG